MGEDPPVEKAVIREAKWKYKDQVRLTVGIPTVSECIAAQGQAQSSASPWLAQGIMGKKTTTQSPNSLVCWGGRLWSAGSPGSAGSRSTCSGCVGCVLLSPVTDSLPHWPSPSLSPCLSLSLSDYLSLSLSLSPSVFQCLDSLTPPTQTEEHVFSGPHTHGMWLRYVWQRCRDTQLTWCCGSFHWLTESWADSTSQNLLKKWKWLVAPPVTRKQPRCPGC